MSLVRRTGKVYTRSLDISGLFWLTRVFSHRTNMLESLHKKRGRFVRALRWKQWQIAYAFRRKHKTCRQIFRCERPVLADQGFQPEGQYAGVFYIKRGAGLSGPSDENSAKSPVPSGENIKNTHRSVDEKGLFRLKRVSSPGTNMPKSAGKKRGGFLWAVRWKQGHIACVFL